MTDASIKITLVSCRPQNCLFSSAGHTDWKSPTETKKAVFKLWFVQYACFLRSTHHNKTTKHMQWSVYTTSGSGCSLPQTSITCFFLELSQLGHAVAPSLISFTFFFQAVRIFFVIFKKILSDSCPGFSEVPFTVFLWTLFAFSLFSSPFLIPDHFQRNSPFRGISFLLSHIARSYVVCCFAYN